jgi:hypothetical protein
VRGSLKPSNRNLSHTSKIKVVISKKKKKSPYIERITYSVSHTRTNIVPTHRLLAGLQVKVQDHNQQLPPTCSPVCKRATTGPVVSDVISILCRAFDTDTRPHRVYQDVLCDVPLDRWPVNIGHHGVAICSATYKMVINMRIGDNGCDFVST